jgi:hypothetical protein
MVARRRRAHRATPAILTLGPPQDVELQQGKSWAKRIAAPTSTFTKTAVVAANWGPRRLAGHAGLRRSQCKRGASRETDVTLPDCVYRNFGGRGIAARV